MAQYTVLTFSYTTIEYIKPETCVFDTLLLTENPKPIDFFLSKRVLETGLAVTVFIQTLVVSRVVNT